MSATPTISCVMAAFNAEQYLEEAVNSILAQTRGDFEFIVVDDGSTDGTAAMLRDFAARDLRIQVIRQDNRGLTRSLQAGAARARGRFIARMDADDIAEPQRFERQSDFLSERNDCVAVGCSLTLIDPDGDVLGEQLTPVTHDEIMPQLMSGNGVLAHPSAMICRKSFEKVGGYRELFLAAQDLDLWLRLAEVGRLANLSERLLRYRLHADSITTRKRDLQLACAQQAVRDARSRRGEAEAEAEAFTVSRYLPSCRTRTLRGWARMALKFQHTAVARKHAWSAFRESPLSPSHWWLLARTFLLQKNTQMKNWQTN